MLYASGSNDQYDPLPGFYFKQLATVVFRRHVIELPFHRAGF